ncbi:MAG: hypothetical protein HFE30_02145 [Clostridiales bacterium]|nr:hypothetical protein [Clostridiales bacterium]
MSEYIKNVMTAGAVCTLVMMLLPHGDGQNGKYVKYICSAVVLLIIISPIRSAASFFTDIKETVTEIEETIPAETEEAEAAAVIGLTAENISEYIISVCGEKFGFDTEKIRVKLVIDDSDSENVIIEEIQLFTDENDRSRRDDLKKYLEELLLTDVRVFGR